jgi:hypothetical protein
VQREGKEASEREEKDRGCNKRAATFGMKHGRGELKVTAR